MMAHGVRAARDWAMAVLYLIFVLGVACGLGLLTALVALAGTGSLVLHDLTHWLARIVWAERSSF